MKLILALALALSLHSAFAADTLPFRAGFAEVDITPKPGMEMPGNYGKVYGQSIHDPCKVRAAVFDDRTHKVALVGVDVLIVRAPLVAAARAKIQERCGIPAQAILIGASHSHSSGPTGMILPGEYDHAAPFIQKLAYEKSSTADAAYLKQVEDAIVSAVLQAHDRKVEAQLAFGSGQEGKVSFNRRHRMKNGQTWTHPGKGNPDMLGYAGPIDPEVGVIGAWDKQDKFLGCIVNFACHATTSPRGFSANWIYYMEKTIRGGMAADVPVVFLQGACGDVTQVDNLNPSTPPNGELWAQRVGGCVGAEALKVLLLAERGTNVPLAANNRTLEIKRRIPSPEKVENSLELVQKPEQQLGSTEWIFAKEIVLLDALIAKSKTVRTEVQAIQVGPAVFLATPAEYFVQFGLDMKKQSNFKLTFPVELANDCVGYVPTEEALSPSGGGYETRLTSYSNLEPTAGRQMLQATLDMARQMTPAPIFEPAKAPPFKAPWSYGNVAPELK